MRARTLGDQGPFANTGRELSQLSIVAGEAERPRVVAKTDGWAQQGLNLRPLPCEFGPGGWHASARVIKSSQSLDSGTTATSVPSQSLASFPLENAPYEPQRRGERSGEKTVAKVVSELPIPSPALFTVSDVARVLRRSPATIYRYHALGQLPARRVGNQLWITPHDLARLLQRQRKVDKSKD